MSKACQHLRIFGKVQGVGYRANLAAQARQLALTGWVRNRSDGSVEAAVCGDEASIDQLLDWARQGPPAARVSNIDVEPVVNSESLMAARDFRILADL